MKLLKTLLTYIVLFGLFSCNNTQKVKVISKYANGNVKETHTFTNSSDTLSFLDTRYHDNRKILYQGHFENGKRQGNWVWYFSNGVMGDSASYRDGEFIGRRVHWDSLGRLTKVEFINGPCYDCCCDGVVISYYSNGKPESEAHMYNGKEQGKYVYYYDNGQPKKEEYFNEDKREGKYYEWYANSKKWVTGFFKGDKMDSIWTWYDTTGKVKSIQEFKEGVLLRNIK